MRADAPLCTVESEDIFMVGSCSGPGHVERTFVLPSKAPNTGFPSQATPPDAAVSSTITSIDRPGFRWWLSASAKRRG